MQCKSRFIERANPHPPGRTNTSTIPEKGLYIGLKGR